MKRGLDYHIDRAKNLLEGRSLEDKLKMIYGNIEEKIALGVPYIDFSGEAAHGVQARHDQDFDLGNPEYTTIFPCPIGMAASFDSDMMHKVGDVVGTEMRSLVNEHRHNALVALAPTVDMERDPRWGRNEEAYGEDPYLTAQMAGNYILGMAGDNKDFVRAGATLKHFYGNNYEKERYTADSVIPENLKNDYYLKVFEDIISYAQPLSVMSSYNKINGVTATFNPELKTLLKSWGVPFVISDAFTLFFSVNMQKTAKDFPDAIKKAYGAGVDVFMEDWNNEIPAIKEAVEKGIVTEEDITEALTHKLTAYSMLGMMIEDLNEDHVSKYFPKEDYNISKVDTAESRQLAREMTSKSVVLLKNDGMLPLSTGLESGAPKNTFLLGPFAASAPLDWYSGLSSHTVTLDEGLGVPYEELIPTVRIKLENGEYVGIADGKLVTVSPESAGVFNIMLWDDSRITLRAMSNGKYLTSRSPKKKSLNATGEEDKFSLYAYPDHPFSWFLNEAFQLIDSEDEVITYDCDTALRFWEDSRIKGIKNVDGSIKISFETVDDTDSLLVNAEKMGLKSDSNIVAAFGLHPMVNCKEERDRDSIELPPFQRAVLRKLRKSYKNISLLLMANAPLAVVEEDAAPEIRSILWSAFGSEELGTGIADILTGKESPAGRLPQTWYMGDLQLPDINDYDIEKNGMTYIYMTEKPLYRFGYGLTYSKFKVTLDSSKIKIKNIGDTPSEFVVTIYKDSDGGYHIYDNDRDGRDTEGNLIPVGSRLVAFDRTETIKPNEEISLELNY